jgi:hypothetical protein
MKKTNLQAALLLSTPEELAALGIDKSVVENIVAPVIDLQDINVIRDGCNFTICHTGEPVVSGSTHREAGVTLMKLVESLPDVFHAVRSAQISLDKGELVPARQTLCWLAERLVAHGIKFEDSDTRSGRELLKQIKAAGIERERTDSTAAAAQEAAADGVGTPDV